jgi:hypothetical protein
MFIDVEQLSFPCIGRGIGAAVPLKSFGISIQFQVFAQTGAHAPLVEKFSER